MKVKKGQRWHNARLDGGDCIVEIIGGEVNILAKYLEIKMRSQY